MATPLMPKATAVWLVDNTTLTFDQIAAFCGLHPLEVKGIADGEVAQGILGNDPIVTGQLTQKEIDRCENDHSQKLVLSVSDDGLSDRKRKGGRYTPLSRRQDRPNAIAWLVRNHPEMSDAQISKIVGTTKPTIQAVRERTHWNMTNIKPVDPVTLGLCKQVELDGEVQKAQEREQKRKDKEEKEAAKARAEHLEAARAAGQPSALLEEEPQPEPEAEPTPVIPAISEADAMKNAVEGHDLTSVFGADAMKKPEKEEEELVNPFADDDK